MSHILTLVIQIGLLGFCGVVLAYMCLEDRVNFHIHDKDDDCEDERFGRW